MLEIKQVKISDLKFSEYNPRIMSETEMAKLVRSIQEFGFVDPVIVNSHSGRENIIIGGHQRVEAAKILGFKEVPVVFVSLVPKKEKLLNLALNRIQGIWDEDKLRDLLKSLEQTDNIDLLLSGFDSAEIDILLREMREERDEDFNVVQELENIKEIESKSGDVYELGPHRLMCGDSTKNEDVDKLMAGKIADMVFTDPPYNVGYESRGRKKKVWKEAYGEDNLPDKEFEEFAHQAFANFKRYLKSGGVYYVCSGWTSWATFWMALKRLGIRPRGCIIWDKGHGGMGWSDFWYQHELIAAGMNFELKDENDEVYNMLAYGFNDKAKHYFASKKRISDVWRVPRDFSLSYEHPTQKPVRLVENAIYNSSKKDELVLDLFAGSGSTLIAAERTGRIAYLMEKSPLFCDVIRRRYEKFKETTNG